MSRAYSIFVRITNAAPRRIETTKEAAETVWPFDDWHLHEGVLSACGDGNLCGGETEAEFALRLAREIWAANAGFCLVEVAATCLEYLPCDTYSLDEDDYQRLAMEGHS